MGKGVPTDDPERIWLQVEYGGSRSWFEHRCFKNDAEYVRADLVTQRTCKNCRYINGEPCETGQWCEHSDLGTWMPPGFGCTLFEVK